MQISHWEMAKAGEPLRRGSRPCPSLGDGEALVRVAGCGVCHTDVGFLYEGVPTRHELPLVLGHEVSGTVEQTGAGANELIGKRVIVPAVMPCGQCDHCRRGRGSICAKQIFPGNDIHGGFASHLVVPANQLAVVPDSNDSIALEHLSVVADAITTPYQAIRRSGLGEGDVAIFVGAGGVGAFGIQIAAALGATVFAIDIDQDRLAIVQEHGARYSFLASKERTPLLKKEIRDIVRSRDLPATEWRIFETSGSPAGQETAFRLLVHGAYLSVIGYTPKSVNVPLSRLMAFDAKAEGNWGCLPELYPEALEFVLDGRVELEPFIETRPMSEVNDVLSDFRDGKAKKRTILIPDFE